MSQPLIPGVATYVGRDMYIGGKPSDKPSDGTIDLDADNAPTGSYAAEAEGLTVVRGKLAHESTPKRAGPIIIVAALVSALAPLVLVPSSVLSTAAPCLRSPESTVRSPK